VVTLASLLSCSLVGGGLDRMESWLGIHWDNIMLIHFLHGQVTFVKSCRLEEPDRPFLDLLDRSQFGSYCPFIDLSFVSQIPKKKMISILKLNNSLAEDCSPCSPDYGWHYKAGSSFEPCLIGRIHESLLYVGIFFTHSSFWSYHEAGIRPL